jgi:hypothetical protein
LISGMRAVQEVAGNGGCSPTKARKFPPISFFSLSFFAPSLFLSLLQRRRDRLIDARRRNLSGRRWCEKRRGRRRSRRGDSGG